MRLEHSWNFDGTLVELWPIQRGTL